MPLLRRLTIATPCNVPWTDMLGDGAIRFCCSCSKDVYDLTAMHPDEAEAFLEQQKQGGATTCVRMYRRPDGRVLTSECAVGARRRHMRRFTATGGGLLLASLVGVFAMAYMPPPVLAPDAPPRIDRGRDLQIRRVAVLGSYVMGEVEADVTPPSPRPPR